MNILLTGSSGFIGRNIKESYLAEKHKIIAPRHSELDLLNEDAVSRFFEKNQIDVVIHSATKPGHRNANDLSNLFYSNTRMFFNLARMSEYFGKMIVIGSGAIYDMRHYKSKVKEEDYNLHIPADDHGFCKYVCEKYTEKSENIIDLRVFGIFGKYEDYAIRFISNMICKAIFDLPLTMNQNRKFDYIYIDDFIKIVEYFIEHKSKYSAYNITPDNSIELYEIAEKVKNIAKKDLPIFVAKDGMGLEYSGDNFRLKNEFSDLKFTKIDDSIKQLYDWYFANRNLLDKNKLLEDK